MPKEWLLNIATNRWGFNKKNNVGPVALWIRECSPKNLEDWRSFYYHKLNQFLKEKNIPLSPENYIEHLGLKLYTKLSEVIRVELENITEQDCIKYIENLIINRTFEGYLTEMNTIYGQLQSILGVEIKPAPDKWDRLYNIDFYIQIQEKIIGLQIKPITYEQTPEIHKWTDWLKQSHERFKREVGGIVFIIFSIKQNNKKVIYNCEVINEIKEEINRLQVKRNS